MVQTVAEIKGWAIETAWIENLEEDDWGVVRRLERNWQRFQKGDHVVLQRPTSARQIP